MSNASDSGVGHDVKMQQYTTARHVFYAETFIALVVSTLLVVALRGTCRASSFRKHKVKGAFRLVLLGIVIGDFLQSSSVLAYVFDLPPGDLRRTSDSTLACTIGSVLSSSGEIASALFTACLAVEGYLIVVKGVRTGERRRAVIYVASVLLILLSVQICTGAKLRFGAALEDNKYGEYVWCSTEVHTTLGKILSFYLWLILGLSVSLICYVRMEWKLRSMLQVEGIDAATKRTIQRSRCKFFSFPIVFIVAWLPTGIHRIVVSQSKRTSWPLLYVAALSAGGLPIMNAIVYMYWNKEERVDLGRFCRKLCCGASCCCFHIDADGRGEVAGEAQREYAVDDGDRTFGDSGGGSHRSFSVMNRGGSGGGGYNSDSSEDDDLPPPSFYYGNTDEGSKSEGLLDNIVFSPEVA